MDTTTESAASGYVMFMRSHESLELLNDPRAFALLAFIAYRARWHSALSVDGLEIGEALIGDHHRAGMTRGEYREATKRLHKYRLATFRATNRGTIAKLASSKVFDINGGSTKPPDNQPLSHQATSQQPSNSHPTTSQRPLTKREKEKGNLLSLNGSTAGPTAEEIFNAYPRKAKKPKALEAINRALRKYPAQFLLDQTRAFAKARPNKHDRFTPYPASWFNAEQFNDDPSTWTDDSLNRATSNRAVSAGVQQQFKRVDV